MESDRTKKILQNLQMIEDADHPGKVLENSVGKGGKNIVVVHLKNTCKLLSRDQAPMSRFPGSQPVSLLRYHLQTLRERSFYVCEKSDGVRYLLLIHKSKDFDTGKYAKVFLVDRKFRFTPLPGLDVLFEGEGSRVFSYMNHTLLDGELIVDEIPTKDGGHKKQAMFLIFDAISIQGRFVGNLDLFDRLRVAQGCVVQRFQDLTKLLPEETQSKLPFILTLKQMYRKEDIGFVLDRVIPALPHENDGLIFTRVDLPFKIGTCEGILKWKPKHMNSVDFEVQVKWLSKSQGDLTKERKYCVLYSARRGTPFEYAFICLSDEEQEMLLEKYEGRPIVIEVTLDDNTQGMKIPDDATSWDQVEYMSPPGWKYMRAREDKSLGNDINTVERVIESINSGITGEYLKEMLSPKKKHRLR